ncbi:MAG: hypothetical protein OEZ02_00710 [Anaerolineae bacterium]|nr:hypothetical protein [Anaerolineae bacterium]
MQDDTPDAETRYRARFYFDPNTITMTAGDEFTLFTGRSATAKLADLSMVSFMVCSAVRLPSNRRPRLSLAG